MKVINLDRQEKIKFCRESVKKTNSNPYVKFEELDEIKLDAWVRYFRYLIKDNSNQIGKE